ncbi:MAG TPA: hypothetical protein VF582_05585 [Allosphingosinicella sp.]|jgi:hypothetical protein
MRRLVLALALAAGLESAALACSCIALSGPDEARLQARDIAPNVVAIVEAEALTEYQHVPGAESGLGEQVRVHKILFGQAPKTLRLSRGPMPSSASCDLLLNKGQRKVLILSRGRDGEYGMHDLCSDQLTSEIYLPIMVEEARRLSGMPRRGGERADNCPKPRFSARA